MEFKEKNQICPTSEVSIAIAIIMQRIITTIMGCQRLAR